MRVALPIALSVALLLTFASLELGAQQPLLIDRVEHHDVDNNGVNVHYVTLGEVVTGETLLFVHGFPNFWYIWHNQMEAFEDEYRIVAMDTRATNRSGKPEGVESYDMPLLLSDINAVIDDLEFDLLREYARDADVLEVGCGTGLILEKAAEVASRAVGVDISDGMLEQARERGLEVAQADASESLPFEDESFDLVYSFKVLAHIEDIDAALQEMAREIGRAHV